MRAVAWVLLAALAGCGAESPLLTGDQRGRVLFEAGRYAEAAELFRDPAWRATALYRAGEFDAAAGLWAGYETAEAAYNQGNALCFRGRYAEGIPRYERALELRSGWADAEVNLAIARAAAERLEQKGGEGVGQLGADEIVVSDKPSSDGGGEDEVVEGGAPLSEEELRATWLRRVRTRPADFLRSRFAYQAAKEQR